MSLEALGAAVLKCRSEPVKRWRLVSLAPPCAATATDFVGRDDELARLATVYGQAIVAPGCRLAVVLGSPGLGKSRLIHEFVLGQGASAIVLRAHCHPVGGATFAPIAIALRAWLAPGPLDPSGRIRRLVPGSGTELDRIVAGLAALVGARPEFREVRSSLAIVGGCVSDVIALGGLDAGAAMRIAANVLGVADLPAGVAGKVLATSEGNPLFVSELVRMLVDESVIVRRGEGSSPVSSSRNGRAASESEALTHFDAVPVRL